MATQEEDKFITDGPGAFKDNYGNIVYPIELVFPIVRLKQNNQFEAVGTGFFVHPAGGFVTAKHCLYDGDNYDDSCYAIHSLGEGRHEIRKIQYFEPHPTGDIGMGMLRGQLTKPNGDPFLRASFPVSLTGPEIGEDIKTFAYPHMTVDKENIGTFPGNWYAGKITDRIENGTAKLKSEVFATSMLIRAGASGGPVLRGNHLIAVNSSGFDPYEDEPPASFITPISQIFDLTLTDSDGAKFTVKELMANGHMPYVP